jgi:hypothetical protein
MRKNKILFGMILLSLFLAIGSSYGATTVILQDGLGPYNGTQDTYIEKESPKTDADLGRSETIYVREQTNTHQRTLLYFDISGIISDIDTVNDAGLAIYQLTGNKAATITPYMIIAGSWYEGDGTGTSGHADWNHRIHNTTTWGNTVPPGDLAPSDYSIAGINAAIAGEWNTWGIKSIVTYWVSNPTKNYGLYLLTGDASNRSFASSDNGTQANRPKLTISYNPKVIPPEPQIPEPASAALLSIGILGLIGRRITGRMKKGGSMKKLLVVLVVVGMLAMAGTANAAVISNLYDSSDPDYFGVDVGQDGTSNNMTFSGGDQVYEYIGYVDIGGTVTSLNSFTLSSRTTDVDFDRQTLYLNNLYVQVISQIGTHSNRLQTNYSFYTNSGSVSNVNFFQYLDPDLAGSISNDYSGTLGSGSTISLYAWDTMGFPNIGLDSGAHSELNLVGWEIDDFSALRTSILGGNYNLRNGNYANQPGDQTMALKWSLGTIGRTGPSVIKLETYVRP